MDSKFSASTRYHVMSSWAFEREATLRTSNYVKDRAHPSVAHKIDCAKVGMMTDPRPWRPELRATKSCIFVSLQILAATAADVRCHNFVGFLYKESLAGTRSILYRSLNC